MEELSGPRGEKVRRSKAFYYTLSPGEGKEKEKGKIGKSRAVKLARSRLVMKERRGEIMARERKP
jgi:hypothetical protein